ncbi:LuxR C-terminal-related transcriptional regulator [Methylobacterium planeticum]|uniref:Response regulator transcription factor n=1 Tax=Methylobacterium planeticum TaxID=2615211 RepID=A0A6N6MRB2_9HYPH|nr:response regulator transcription factor [Methylobacterium planeticum]KAB1072678.1 response regulator transcription factor [Methylobacterium planeticum]
MSAATPLALVADGDGVVRTAVAGLLTRECGVDRVIEAASLDEALMLLDEHAGIRFAAFDLAIPGIGTPLNLRSVREVFPDIRIAVTGGNGRRDEIFQALQASLHGYLPRAFGPSEVAAAFRHVLAGGVFVPPSLADLPLPSEAAASFEPSRAISAGVRLTPRQQDVLRLIRSGKSNKEIARTLGLTENTVKVHANALYRALGVRDRTGAAQRADLP